MYDHYARTFRLSQRLVHDVVSSKLREFQLLYAAPLINAISKTVDQSEDLGGGASVASFC